MTDEPAWRPTTAFVVSITVGLVLLVLAATSRRAELALFAVPLLTEVAWSLRRVARSAVAVSVRPSAARLREGDAIDVRVDVAAPTDADAVVTVLETEPLLATADPLRPVCALPDHASRVVPAVAARWGRQPSAQLFASAWAAHGLLHSDPVHGTGDTVVVEPAAVGVRALRPRTRTGVVGPWPSGASPAGRCAVAPTGCGQ